MRRLASPALAALFALALVRCSASSPAGDAGLTANPGSEAGGDAATTDGSAGEASCSNDIAVDPKNCGGCGHDCLGGACLAGLCQPVVLAYDRSRPSAVAVDATYVYWLEPGALALGRVPKSGGALEVFAGIVGDLSAKHLQIDDTRVYWSDALKVATNTWQTHHYSVPKDGLDAGARIQYGATGVFGGIGAPVLGGLTLDGTNVFLGGPTANIWRQPKDGGAGATAFFTPGALPTTVAAEDGGLVYGTVSGEVYRLSSSAPADGGLGTPIATGQGDVEELFTAGADMFWINVEKGTIKIAKNGTTVEVFAGALDAPLGLAIDDTNVYWTEKNAVRSCPRTGCGAGPRVIAENQATPAGITVDATSIYWTTVVGGTVVKVAK